MPSSAVLVHISGEAVQVAEPPGKMLGEVGGKAMLVDRDAAGDGCFIVPTPRNNLEFTRLSLSVLAARPRSTPTTAPTCSRR